jgi:hypothetical protein
VKSSQGEGRLVKQNSTPPFSTTAPTGVNHAAQFEILPSPVRFTTRPLCTAMVGSIRSLRSARSRASMRSSSAPASRLYPTTSAASIAASFRVSAMTYLPPQARLGRVQERERFIVTCCSCDPSRTSRAEQPPREFSFLDLQRLVRHTRFAHKCGLLPCFRGAAT